MTTLALKVPPVPGEAWHGYLSRTAAQHGADAATLADRIGLRRQGRWPGYHGVLLEGHLVVRCAAAMNLTPDQVNAMQLSALDGTVCDLTSLGNPGENRLRGTRQVSYNAWVFLAGGRYCPICLGQDGVWKLAWKVPWITTCAEHRTWLEHTCADCGGTIGRYNGLNAAAPSRARTRIGSEYCDLPRGAGVCGADLSAQRARPATAAASDLTAAFTRLITCDAGRFAGVSHRSLPILRAWQSTIGLSIALQRSTVPVSLRNHRWSSPPRDARLFNRLIQDAAPLATADSPAEASHELLTWCRHAGLTSPHRGTFARATQSAPVLEPVLATALATVGRAHIRIERKRRDDARTLPLMGWGPDDVPQLVWPCALPLHRRDHRHPDQRILRAVVAMILVRMHDGQTWSSAGSVLGIPPGNATNWTRYCFSHRFTGLKEDLLQAADHLSALLPRQPQRGAWSRRPEIAPGDGRTSLKPAQAPTCRLHDPTSRWCPCPEAHP